MAGSSVAAGGGTEDAFRKVFKFYKSRNPPPDLSAVIDFCRGTHGDKVVPANLDPAAVSDADARRVGLRPARDWRAFNLKGYPGFIFISNPFFPEAHVSWTRQCLRTYPQKPNVCNLDMHMSPSDTHDLWGQSAHAIRSRGSGKRQPKTLLEKLRWVTLGYHYDWNTKTYSADHHTAFPSALQWLSDHVAAACGFQGFRAEAGILNYYHSDSSLGIHVDEAELDHSKPLLSFSFGQSAVFLLGGPRREDAPSAMFMHSGDVMLMSGSSRLRYHAVPCIVTAPRASDGDNDNNGGGRGPPGTTESHSSQGWRPDPDDGASLLGSVSEEEREVCRKYMQSSRVNMTVRQVLGPGQSLEKPPGPGESLEKPPGPGESLEKPPGPGESLEKPPGPGQSLEKPPGPGQSLEKPPGPGQSLEKPPGPGQSLEKPPGPGQSLEKPPGPGQSLEKAPGPGQSLEKPPGPGQSLEKPPGPGESLEKPPGPGQSLQDPPGWTCVGQTRTESTSTGQKRRRGSES